MSTSPSAESRPPWRRSQIRSQCTADSFVPPVSGYERPSARWTVPPIFSSNRIVPDRAVDAEVRADAELAEAARAPVGLERRGRRYSSPRWPRRAPTTSPSRNSSSTPSTSTPRGADGIVKRIRPSARVLVRAGEDLARGHVALAVGVDPRAARRRGACRSVPSASMRMLARRRQPRDQPAWNAAQLAPGGDRVVAGRGTARGATNAANSRERHARLLRPAPRSATAWRTSASASSASRSGRARAGQRG